MRGKHKKPSIVTKQKEYTRRLTRRGNYNVSQHIFLHSSFCGRVPKPDVRQESVLDLRSFNTRRAFNTTNNSGSTAINTVSHPLPDHRYLKHSSRAACIHTAFPTFYCLNSGCWVRTPREGIGKEK